MANEPKRSEPEKSDTLPDSWERFEMAVDAALHSGLKHRERQAPKPSVIEDERKA